MAMINSSRSPAGTKAMKSSRTTPPVKAAATPAKNALGRDDVAAVMNGFVQAAMDPLVREEMAKHIKGAAFVGLSLDTKRYQITIAPLEKSWNDGLHTENSVFVQLELDGVRASVAKVVPPEAKAQTAPQGKAPEKKAMTFDPPLSPIVETMLAEIEKAGAAFNRENAATLDRVKAEIAESQRQGIPYVMEFKGDDDVPLVSLDDVLKPLGK